MGRKRKEATETTTQPAAPAAPPRPLRDRMLEELDAAKSFVATMNDKDLDQLKQASKALRRAARHVLEDYEKEHNAIVYGKKSITKAAKAEKKEEEATEPANA